MAVIMALYLPCIGIPAENGALFVLLDTTGEVKILEILIVKSCHSIQPPMITSLH